MGRNTRTPFRWNLPPVLVGELRAARVPIFVHCPSCSRSSLIDPALHSFPDDADLARLSRALKCEGCGRKGGISAVPDSASWIRYLRASGQTDRLPWHAPFVRGGEEGDG